MKKKYKYKQILFLGGLIALIGGLFGTDYISHNLEGEISGFSQPLKNNRYGWIIMEGEKHNFFFDTGYTTTTIYDTIAKYKNRIPISIFFHRSSLKPEFKYYFYTFVSDYLHIKNLGILFLPLNINPLLNDYKENGDSIFIDYKKPLLVIGMNLIKEANWIYNKRNTERQIKCIPHDIKIKDIPYLKNKEVKVVLPYTLNSISHLPVTDLKIDGETIKGVTIDTGHSGFLQLKQECFEKLSFIPNGKPQTKKVTLYNKIEEHLMQKYKKRTCRINGFSMENVQPYWSSKKKNLLGMGFFNRFEYIFIDTQKQIVYCF